MKNLEFLPSQLVQRVGKKHFLIEILLALSMTSNAQADEPVWHTTSDSTLYGYANNTELRSDSLINPCNRIALLSQNSATTEVRLNFKTENEKWRLTLRPIVLVENDRNAFGSRQPHQAYLSQWQLRLRASEAWSLAAGREVMNWGPAQFRSPSSPFYFNNGRTNPMQELSGVDALKLSWTPDMNNTLMVSHLSGSGHIAQNTWSNSWLFKADRRNDSWVNGLVLEHTPQQGAFFGGHTQFSANDALLWYAEASSSTLAKALQSPSDLTVPFSVVSRSSRRTEVLTGAAYTFQNGQTLNTEILYYGHGFSSQQEAAYFSRAAVALSLAEQALGKAPQLLGREYLHLVWQSNLMETRGYWRAMLTHNLTDNGNELSAYSEMALNNHVTAFALGALPIGNSRQEFSSLFRRSITAGLKLALP